MVPPSLGHSISGGWGVVTVLVISMGVEMASGYWFFLVSQDQTVSPFPQVLNSIALA